ncbi:unnamed protein product [Thelazia callipaeda]|uniref:Beta_helix domain-containing protein n=1 Tax=Thelazia callipaeda TaxID=103827 RepID=A0A0N5CSV7_THECL|nr:unnamed protein product [Thelazia callipaeda]
MEFADGGFWKWYRRDNNTYPFVMPKPGCHANANSLWDCEGLRDANSIQLSENLCQGEDDIGIQCWGIKNFSAYEKHWKGLRIISSSVRYANTNSDMISLHRESNSKLEYVDILYAGYDGSTRNTSAAIWIEGISPIINGLRIENSAGDGIYIKQSDGPIVIANSTITKNRGHGIAVINSTDGRVFINMTFVTENYGDGIHYREAFGEYWYLAKMDKNQRYRNQIKREQSYRINDDKTVLDMCNEHKIPSNFYFPHLIHANLINGTVIDSNSGTPCWMVGILQDFIFRKYGSSYMYD